MRRARLTTLIGLLLTLGLTAPAWAQQYVLNQTTLSAAVTTASQTTFSLTSTSAASGSTFGAVAVGQALLVDHELDRITAVGSGSVTVTRDPFGATTHASGAAVYIGSPSAFKLADPAVGTCTAADVPSPWVNAQAGRVWSCLNSTWTVLAPTYPAAGVVYAALNTAIASASTIAPNLGVTHITGTTAINTITVPAGCGGACQITLIPDALGSTGTSGNIAIGSTFVVSKALILTWDGSKWRPSY